MDVVALNAPDPRNGVQYVGPCQQGRTTGAALQVARQRIGDAERLCPVENIQQRQRGRR